MECKSLYKNNFVKPGSKSKVAADLYHKTQRQESRHEIRQSFRNMHDSDEENDVGLTQNDHPPCPGDRDKGKRPKNKAYGERLNRLLRFRELRQMQKQLQQARHKKDRPFIPVVSQSEIVALAEWELQLSNDVLRKLEAKQKEAQAPACSSHHKPAKLVSALMSTTPRLEKVATGSNGAKSSSARKAMTPRFKTVVTGSTSKNHAPKQPLSENNRTPVPPAPRVAHAASRVDCWRRDNLPPGVTNRRKQQQGNTPVVPLCSKKPQVGGTADPASLLKGGIKKPSKPVKDGIRQKPLKALENVRLGVAQQSRPLVPKSREFKFTLKPTDAKANQNSKNPMVTSTIRKLKKPLPFSIAPSDGYVLKVPNSETFFDGISPIEIETPLKEQPGKVHGRAKEHSLWEPQPVAEPVVEPVTELVTSEQQGKNTFEVQKEHIKQKTNFYYNKVECERNRLEELCNRFGAGLEFEELNDHCKGLILAAQGQTNILIHKKLTKFRELIEHYEKKWDDRKVRHDDLDGFWQMVSLDLENLDKRFAELQRLKDNNWQEEQEPVVEEPPKVKKLQAGGGVRKREKKPAVRAKAVTKSSSAIADIIRKARREQQNQNIIELEPLAETVMAIASPVKLMSRISDTPKRSSILKRRSSICQLCSPDVTNKINSPSLNRRNTVFVDAIKADVENVKRGLKTSISGRLRGKSVLFIDEGLETPKSSRRSTRFVVDNPKPHLKLNDESENNVDDREEPQKQPKRRSLSQFTEENDLPATELSESNLRLDEKISLSLTLSPQTKLIQKPSLVATTKTQMPEEVQQKTVFYNNKVGSERKRLEALCNDYVPFLGCEELSDHCKGLILAAQGQTNILIHKKLTKFRELIGHYETKWDDRKVRHDDLDGFWQMVSLDLENLDKRFAELHRLKDNNWQEEQEPFVEDPPKVKKLQAGGGVRKREKKPTANGATKASSAIADLIRKVRKDQKQKALDLGPLTETVNLTATPIKRSSRNTENSKCNYDSDFAPCVSSPAVAKRYTIFPGMNPLNGENIKSILKTPSVGRKESRSKSVLFLDASETPQAAQRQSSRLIVATPKPKLTFSDHLEFEHIDNLDLRTPSRFDGELHKRRQQSGLTNFMAKEASQSSDDEVFVETPRRRTRTSRTLSAIFSANTGDGISSTKEQVMERSAKRNTRATSSRVHIET
ncbi:uncharacterized protein LOC131206435 [Anopheles bellator]|uniref:uncharacterized protein LOC131206435 n=1 Tax=Anopheles bellator TaxID=139047 RepID=UPI0026483E24|nr:uncharacterized protein LOC131206435 [Anopheles bellator]